MKLNINWSEITGKIKPMNAVNNGPVSSRGNGNLDNYIAANIPYARTHDASFYAGYGGYHTVDVHVIFPDFDADPYDPANYDFQLTDENVDLSELPARLTKASPEGIVALEAYEMSRKVKELKWLRIAGRFEYDDRSLAEMADALNKFYAADSIVIEKKTKRGMGQSDIAPAIKEISFEAGEDCVKLSAVISAQEPTLNPDLLASALRQLAPQIAPDFAEFERLEVFDENMEIFR